MEFLLILLGAGLTILGGYLANRQSFKLTQVTERSNFLKGKIEEMVALSNSMNDWLDALQENTFAIPVRHTPGEPMDKLYILSRLYFPTLWNDVHPVCETARLMGQTIRAEASRRLKNEGFPTEEFPKEYLPLHAKLIEHQHNLVKALADYVEHKFASNKIR